jgi:AcrR family transcriptional regulator
MTLASRDEFRARAVSAARELFITKGFEETSMTDVGDALGVSKPTVYEAFPSKLSLLEAVVDKAVNDLNMSLTKATARGEHTLAEYISRMPDECWSMVTDRERSAMYRLLIQEGPSVPTVAHAFATRIMTNIYPIYDDLFARAIAAGECRQISATDGRRLFMSPVNTVMLQIGMMKGMPIDEAATRSFFNHYFRMLADYLVPRPA